MRDLSIQSMMLICGSLVENQRKLLEDKPLLALLLPELEALSQQLTQSRHAESPTPHQAASLRQALRELDERHDSTNRLLFTLLDLAAQVSESSEAKEEYLSVQAQLYPNKLAINRATYEQEAGEAIRLGSLLTQSAELKKTLSSFQLQVQGKIWQGDEILRTLEKVGNAMQDNLQALHIAQSEPSPSSSSTSQNERQARLRFFELFRVLQTNAALVYGASSKEYDTLFRSYNEEIRKQKARARPRSTEKTRASSSDASSSDASSSDASSSDASSSNAPSCPPAK